MNITEIEGEGVDWLKYFRIGSIGGALSTRSWKFGFYKKQGIAWPAVRVSASQEGLYSSGLFNIFRKWKETLKTDW